ncbi:MAG TPA: carbamoyl phosphate synthase large subunit, partial [Noviherbaspirillum sp.]|nr:carbamoyl phosphate synthase large subunit [Noviherbaspirillum sp.]
CMVGQSLDSQGIGQEVVPPYYSVKEAVFPFNKFPGVDTILGPEMKSTGEVMGVGKTFGEAFVKSQLGAGVKLPKSGKVFLSVKNSDKPYVAQMAKDLVDLGFSLVVSKATAKVISNAGIDVVAAEELVNGFPCIVNMIARKEITLVIMTVDEKRASITDSRGIRLAALAARAPFCTTLRGAQATIAAIRHMDTYDLYSLRDLYKTMSPVEKHDVSALIPGGRFTPEEKDVSHLAKDVAAQMKLVTRGMPEGESAVSTPDVAASRINLFIRQPFTESGQQEQDIIAQVLQLIDGINGFPYNFNYLTGGQAESAATFKKSFELKTSLPFTPQNFRDHRLTLLDQADAVVNIRVGMSESSAFELAYHIFKGRRTPILFLVWKQAPVKTTLLKELENLCDITYLEFEHVHDLKPGIQAFFSKRVLGSKSVPQIMNAGSANDANHGPAALVGDQEN